MIPKSPLSVELFITNECNLKCKYCINNSGDKTEELTLKEWKRIIDELAELKVFNIGLNGGEPLLRKELVKELIKYMNSKGIAAILTTNATLLDEEMVNFLSKQKVLCVRISLDSSKSEMHDKSRGVKGAYEKTISNIKMLIGKRDPKLQTVILTSVSKNNYKDLPNIIKLCKELKVDSINIFPVIPGGRAKNMKNELLEKQKFKEFLEWLIREKKKQKDITILGDFPLQALLEKQSKNTMTRVCPAAMTSIVINQKGQVYACPYFKKPIANVLKTPIQKIWLENEFLKKLRDVNRFTDKCSRCDKINMCRGGCTALTYFIKGTIKESDPYCWYEP